jgi:DNA-binding CsgD family transcriptional regulator
MYVMIDRLPAWTMKQIARPLKIKARTVAFYKYGMMRKLGIRTSSELVLYAVIRHIMPA